MPGDFGAVGSAGPGSDVVGAVDLEKGVLRLLTPAPGYTGGRAAYSPSADHSDLHRVAPSLGRRQ